MDRTREVEDVPVIKESGDSKYSLKNIYYNTFSVCILIYSACYHFVPGAVTLSMVMSFFTGSDSIPPLGLPDAVLNFNLDNIYPTASTCAIELTLPSKLHSYEEFKANLTTAFTMHGGFGLK